MRRRVTFAALFVMATATSVAWHQSRVTLQAQSDAEALLKTGVVPTSPDPGYKLPRTAWGHPDLQGMWENSEEIGIPIEKPRGEVRKLVTQEDAFDEADKRGGPTGAGPKWWYETKPFNGRT